MQVKNQQLEPDMEQWIGSKLGKEYVKAVYCHLACLTYMQSTLCEMPGWMKHKMESRLLGERSESCSVVSDSLQPHGLHSPWNSPGQNTEVGSFSLLQGIFPTQGSNLGLLHCRLIIYQLSYKGSPPREISINSDMQMTPPLWQKAKN